MVLDGEATPVSQLSGAFLKPKSPMHLQFAYYESSMVVEYLVERHGRTALKRVLTDLGDGIPINDALSRHTEPIKKLDEDFATWFQATGRAAWRPAWIGSSRSCRPTPTRDEIATWNKDHPKNFWGLLAEAGRSLVECASGTRPSRRFEEAVALFPDYAGQESPYALLAAVHRELNETEAERAVLEKLVSLDADAGAARLRLAELAADEEDWKAVAEHSTQALAINPLIPAPHRRLAKAAEALGERIVGNRCLPGAVASGAARPAPTHTIAWPGCCATSSACRKRAAMSSSRWSRRRDTERHIGCCWRSSNAAIRMINPRR